MTCRIRPVIRLAAALTSLGPMAAVQEVLRAIDFGALFREVKTRRAGDPPVAVCRHPCCCTDVG
jgi:hypothetical protein